MELINSLTLLLLASISVLIFFKLIERSNRSSAKLPPGPLKLPFLGNVHNLMGSMPHLALFKLAQKYGPVMRLQLGELSAIVISSPEVAKEIMRTHDINFASRPPILAAEIIAYNCTSIGFSPYGDYWRQLRRICTLELLSPKRVQSYRSIREEVFSDLIRWVGSNEGSVVNLTEKLYASAYDVTSRTSLGKTKEEHKHLVSVIKEVVSLAGGFDVADLYPSIGLLQVPSRRRLLKLHKETDRIFDEILRDHKRDDYSVKRSDDDEKEALVDVLLKLQDDGLELPLTSDNVKSVILDMFIGGSDTTATTMDWAMSEMLRNPETLKKAQHEVRKLFDSKGHVDESDVHELSYLKSVIKETLRMHPPIPLLLPRKGSQSCVIDGYEIPANTKVIVNAWTINRDPKYWSNPNSFKPERFSDSSIDFRGNSFEYIPFGAGRRICPGITFGMANVELELAMLLYHFDWTLHDGMKPEDMDMSEASGATTRRKQRLLLVPVVKRALPLN